jgi:hypothetical protein
MKSEEFIRQQIKAGQKIHFSKGVWWRRASHFFYKPALPLEIIKPGSARPGLKKLFLGYSHLVGSEKDANRHWNVMLLDEEKLKSFGIKSVSSAKRARVRKGLRLNDIKKIDDMDKVIEEMKEICISAAKRTGHGKEPEYYIKRYEEWKKFMKSEFSLPQREWWGAFCEGKLVAYFYAYHIGDAMFISAAKSHTDFLEKCPNDALLFSFLEYCRDMEGCKKVIFGDWSKDAPSLNEFKERYGFGKASFPVYMWVNPIAGFYLKRTGRLFK